MGRPFWVSPLLLILPFFHSCSCTLTCSREEEYMSLRTKRWKDSLILYILGDSQEVNHGFGFFRVSGFGVYFCLGHSKGPLNYKATSSTGHFEFCQLGPDKGSVVYRKSSLALSMTLMEREMHVDWSDTIGCLSHLHTFCTGTSSAVYKRFTAD